MELVIKWKRKERGLTQNKASTDLDISESYLCLLECGKRTPGKKLKKKIEEYYGHSWSYLAGAVTVKYPNKKEKK